MITLILLIGLFLITLSFVLYKRKALLMLRALFSKRYLQQLLREGKLLYERIYLYFTLLHLFILPGLLLIFFQLCIYETKIMLPQPLQFYAIIFTGYILLFFLARLILEFFTNIFNYQDQRLIYLTTKALFRFYNALLLMCFIPIMWYTRTYQIIYFVYLPLFVIIFFTFFIQFLRNINGISRINFFIYFCSLEILPYLLLLKLFIIKL